MKTSRYLYWSAQIFGWLFYGVMLLLSTYAYNPEEIDPSLFVTIFLFIFFAILYTHLMRNIFFQFNWLEMKLSPLVPRIIIVSIVCALSLSVTLLFASRLIESDESNGTPMSFLKVINEVVANSILLFFWNALYFTYHFFSKSRKQELHNLALIANRNEIELKNLRSQLNPHFLFNSLNSIRALIELNPEKAKNAVTSLSTLLRKSLLMGKQNLVSVSEEIQLVANYLELEKIRFEERLTIYWDLDPTLTDFLIPPFCIQMQVENAVKHGVTKRIAGGEILIKTTQKEKIVQIIIENSGNLQPEIDLGIGLENTQRRLDLQYNGTATLNLYEQENKVLSVITFYLP
jgi:two-component system, LytTR family, sensor kinase